METQRQRLKILDILIDVIDMEQAIARIGRWIAQCRKVYICVAPVSTVMSAVDDDNYRKVVNQADLVTPDGMPLVWIARARGQRAIGRVCGPDLMRQICTDPCLAHWRHFFYGSTSRTLEELQRQLCEWNPDIKICGAVSPPFREEAQKEDPNVIEQINAARADIVWVGLGAPKQDVWMALNRDALEAPVLIGIGAAFDFLAGIKSRAPRWMQRAGLEWLFRLWCEPRRLWRRYVIGNTRFCWELLKNWMGIRYSGACQESLKDVC